MEYLVTGLLFGGIIGSFVTYLLVMRKVVVPMTEELMDMEDQRDAVRDKLVEVQKPKPPMTMWG